MRRTLTADDKVYRCGKRVILRRDDDKPIAKLKRWLLVEVEDWSKDNWISLKLVYLGQARKNVYYLGWKTDRMARNRDKAILDVERPEIAEWITESMILYQREKTARNESA